jgi:hypothetical protein
VQPPQIGDAGAAMGAQRAQASSTAAAAAAAHAGAAGRVYGSGIQADGVFSNLSAKPERTEGEKEEQPPVCVFALSSTRSF